MKYQADFEHNKRVMKSEYNKMKLRANHWLAIFRKDLDNYNRLYARYLAAESEYERYWKKWSRDIFNDVNYTRYLNKEKIMKRAKARSNEALTKACNTKSKIHFMQSNAEFICYEGDVADVSKYIFE
ncbi:hypothetical protein MAIT1_01490 [Magnetofaba australis IT-1]|uniref:Uncharacterized protein n=2 Tax=Magnetofaba TaxID=1472292 RepID=A0A1Y2K394_9PROT|nr:hypothetical protein MAIT1_01490 [Magnetofaba australis IT-1]